MISSRAIFIGQKKSKALLVLLFIMLGLNAAPYRIGVALSGDGGNVPYVSSFSSLLSFSSLSIGNETLISSAEERDYERAYREYEKSLASAYRKESDTSGILPPERAEAAYSGLVVPLSLDEDDISFISGSDQAAVDYIKLLNDLDELFLIRVRDDAGLTSVEIFLDGELLFTFLYSEYVESNAEEEILTYLVSRYRGEEYALCHVTGNTSASILIDGDGAERYGSYLITMRGLRRFTIVSPSYEPLNMDVMVDESPEEISYTLKSVRTMPLFISSIPYTDQIYYQGRPVSAGYVEDTTYPFSLIVNKDGFESRTVQSDRAEHSVVTTLLPSELYDPDRLEEKKGEFYTHLLITLLTYGTSIAIDVVSDLYSIDLGGVSTLAKGVSVVELIRTVTALFEYRDALGYGI